MDPPRINLLYIITKLELGGAQTQTLSLLRQLDSRRFKTFLFTAQDGMLLPEATCIPNLTVYRSRFLERPLNPLKDAAAVWEILRFIKAQGITVVHTHSSKAGILGRFAARLAGVRHIFHTVHGWPFHDYQPRPLRWLYCWLERLAAISTERLIVVCQSDREKGLANRIGRPVGYQLIRYGIDQAAFQQQPAGLPQEWKIKPADLIVTALSCFKPQKGLQDFLEVAALVTKNNPRVTFLLVGDGVLRRSIEQRIVHLGLSNRVILAGWRRDVPALLSGSDVCMLTSRWEGLPVFILEAMAAGRPVVATDTGGIREVVRDGQTGFLTPPRDVAGLAEKLTLLLDDESLRRRMGLAGAVALDGEYTFRQMIERHQALYEQAGKEQR